MRDGRLYRRYKDNRSLDPFIRNLINRARKKTHKTLLRP